MSDSIRQEMVTNAVSFLTDPSVNDTPLTKKIQFLESKGMSNPEIQQALLHSQQQNLNSSQAQQSNIPTSSSVVPTSNYPTYYGSLPPPPQPPRSYDWKDYVIMGTTTVGFLYGAYQIISRYVIPNVIPPTQSKLDDDKEAMEREFERVETILKKLENDQLEFIKNQDEKSNKIDDVLIEIDAIIKSTNEKNLRNEETLKYLKLEIDSIKTTLLKNLESQKSTISNELQELEKKTDSLKDSLSNISLKDNKIIDNYNRNNNIPSSTPTPPPPSNLLTNNRSTSSIPTISTSYPNLNIPPPSSVPSAKDILGSSLSSSTPNSNSDSNPIIENETTNKEPTISQPTAIPAWQLASSQKAAITDNQNTSIPAWQLAAQEN